MESSVVKCRCVRYDRRNFNVPIVLKFPSRSDLSGSFVQFPLSQVRRGRMFLTLNCSSVSQMRRWQWPADLVLRACSESKIISRSSG